MKKDEYIASAVSKISNKKAKRETERELGEHIDELTEFYLDRNMTVEEAEQRAVADMGTPESVSSSLGKLHTGAGKRVYIALLILLLVFGEAESIGLVNICYSVEALHLHRLLYYGDAHLEFEFFYTDIVLPYVILFVLIIIGYRKYKPLLDYVLAIFLFSTAKAFIYFFGEDGMYWFPLSLASFPPPLILLILTFVLLLLLDKEEDMLNGYNQKSRTVKRLIRILTAIAILTLVTVCYSSLLKTVPQPYSSLPNI